MRIAKFLAHTNGPYENLKILEPCQRSLGLDVELFKIRVLSAVISIVQFFWFVHRPRALVSLV